MNSPALSSPYLDLSAVIRALPGAVGGWTVRGLLSDVLALLLYRRLGQICQKIERLVARFQAGRLWQRKPGARAGARSATKMGAQIWPGQFAWLVRKAGYQAAGYGCQLEHILGQPEMVALLKATPQAARILRPVCRMLGIETSFLQPGVVMPEPVVRVPKLRVRKPRPKLDFGRIPLPRGVLSAARRAGFGKDR